MVLHDCRRESEMVPKRDPKWSQNGSQTGPKMAPEMDPKRIPKWIRKWAQNGSQNGPQNGSKTDPEMGPEMVPKRIPAGSQNGSVPEMRDRIDHQEITESRLNQCLTTIKNYMIANEMIFQDSMGAIVIIAKTNCNELWV